MSRTRWSLAILSVALLALAVRGPLHVATYSLPLSNDDAIPLLMARHILKGELSTILWNQPYNGALDAYLLAAASWTTPHAAFRAYEAACAVLLVILTGLLAACAAGPRAGWMAALLAAVGSPYMGLMATTGPPPNFLVPLLVAAVLLAAYRALRPQHAFGVGLVAGLAIWDSVLAAPALLGVGAGLVVVGMRPRLRSIGWHLAGLALGLAPLFIASSVGASAPSPVMALRPRWLWVDGAEDLLRATWGLLGIDVPLVIDGPERAAILDPARFGLGLALFFSMGVGAVARRAWPLIGWALGLAGAFALSRRTGGDEVRYLYGLVIPIVALAGIGLATVWVRRRATAVALGLAIVVPWVLGHRILVRTWADPSHAARVWQVPSLEPVLSTLERARVTSAYASLQFAARLSLEAGGDMVVSQAWNERIPGDPLRFRDEVDLDPQPAWVLSHHLSRGMPRAGGFREILGRMGGTWKEDLPGDFAIFRSFRPPYDESRPVPSAAIRASTLEGVPLPDVVVDRDTRTTWTSPRGITRGAGLRIQVEPARVVSALVLGLDVTRQPLAVPWVCEVDGTIVSTGPERHGLQWVNGAPRAGKQALMVIPVGNRVASDLRLVFQTAGPPLVVSEVFVYGPGEVEHAPAGVSSVQAALQSARAGDWASAVRSYEDAIRLEPHRASYHACLTRARWRAARRPWLDVESLDDGGEALVSGR